jgi:hypothetical protein
MNSIRNHEAGRRHAAAISFTAIRPHTDRVEFDGTGDDGALHRFTITASTLRDIGQSRQPDAALISLFEGRKQSIFAVASRAFNAGVRGDPIELPRGLFRDF